MLLSEKEKSGVSLIVSFALRSIPRLSWGALIFLTISFFCSNLLGDVFRELRLEQGKTYEITANTESQVDLNALSQIGGVLAVSPLLDRECTLDISDYTLSCQCKGVYSSYLQDILQEGVIFPDGTTMPYLLLNQVAIESLNQENGEKLLNLQQKASFSIGEESYQAVVCGIVDDSLEEPVVYMSYDTAIRGIYGSDITNLIFRLENRGAVKETVSALQRNGLSPVYDTQIEQTWNAMEQQLWLYALGSVTLSVCAAVLIMERKKLWASTWRWEYATLLDSGLTKAILQLVEPLRLAFAQGLCFLLASTAALAAETFSIYSIFLCGISGFCIGVFCKGDYT